MWRRNKAFSRQEKLREFHYKFKQDMLKSILQVEQSKDANKQYENIGKCTTHR